MIDPLQQFAMFLGDREQRRCWSEAPRTVEAFWGEPRSRCADRPALRLPSCAGQSTSMQPRSYANTILNFRSPKRVIAPPHFGAQ